MHVQIPSAKPAGGHRRSLRLIVPLPPRASPRAALEAQVDFLLAILDRIDGDPDLEETGDLEPSIGTSNLGMVDVEGDTSDDEPSLGSLDRMTNQSHWCGNANLANGLDLELDRADDEPSLGSLSAIDQGLWSHGDRRDREVEVRP